MRLAEVAVGAGDREDMLISGAGLDAARIERLDARREGPTSCGSSASLGSAVTVCQIGDVLRGTRLLRPYGS